MMKSALVFVAVLVAGHLETYEAASLTEEKMESCITALDPKLGSVVVPEELKRVADDLRSLNPSLKDLSLGNMLEDSSANLDMISAGIVTPEQKESLLDKCNEYADDLVPILNDTECGEELLIRLESGSPNGHAKLEELLGYTKVCSKLFQ